MTRDGRAWKRASARLACAAGLGCLLLAALLAVPGRAGLPVDGGTAPVGRVKSGTGFFVARDGFLATSNHVVTGCAGISIWGPDGVERSARIVARDRVRDVALLATADRRAHPSPAWARLGPSVGEPVFTLGFGVVASEPLRPIETEGAFVGDSTAPHGNRILLIRARLRAGNSGGAALDSAGSLVGMVIGREESRPEFGVLIPSSDVIALVSAYGISTAAAPRRPADQSPQTLLRAISVLVQCVPVR